MKAIQSRSNSKIKAVRSLRRGKNRQESGKFIVEGIRHVGEADEAGAKIEAIFYAPEMLRSNFGLDLVHRRKEAGTPCYSTGADAFRSMAEKDNPQGILAVVEWRATALENLDTANFPWGVALVAPQDPGNIGTIMRSIDAAGASGLLLLDESADPTHPSAVRASLGSLFWLPIVQAPFAEFENWASANSYNIIGTSAHAVIDYRKAHPYKIPAILLMGSERTGLTAEQASICDVNVRIPMHGKATSLNLAIATALMLYTLEEDFHKATLT